MTMHTETPTGEAVHVIAGYLGTDAADRRAVALASAWAASVADAHGHRPDGQLNAEDRALLMDWLDQHGRDALLTVALDPATRITGDGADVVTQGEPIEAAGATVTVQRMTDEADFYVEHVVATLSDEPLTATQAREVAAALLAAADTIDGRETEIATTPATVTR